jgi:hypothetical protein
LSAGWSWKDRHSFSADAMERLDMRIILAFPLLALGACSIDNDTATTR